MGDGIKTHKLVLYNISLMLNATPVEQKMAHFNNLWQFQEKKHHTTVTNYTAKIQTKQLICNVSISFSSAFLENNFLFYWLRKINQMFDDLYPAVFVFSSFLGSTFFNFSKYHF